MTILDLPDTTTWTDLLADIAAGAKDRDLDDVNPFDQPGVEAYKKNMFALLGKPGYEALRQELAEKLHRA